MEKDQYGGLLVILGIIGLALFSGIKGPSNNGLVSSNNKTPVQKQVDIQKQITETQKQVETVQKQVALEEKKKTESQYKDIVTLSYVSRSTSPSQEYISIHVSGSATTSIPVTGWTIKSQSSGVSVQIPKGTYLFFAGIPNSEDPIYLEKEDTLYLVTGISPNGASFKTNKCSGYLGQFQKFVPYLSSSCPAPRNEDLSSIPKSPVNDDCFDHINSFPSCRIQTESLPANWTYECTSFIYNKINYPSCVNVHRSDKDFYKNEWRVYLKRSERLWKDDRESLVLYDNTGKIVDTLAY